jgi:hypothetical protein
MPISDKLIDQLLEGYDSPDDIIGEAGLLTAHQKGGRASVKRRDGATSRLR